MPLGNTLKDSQRKTNRVLLIDNYDSFTYNLYQYMCQLGAQVTVKRNDEVDISYCLSLNPDRIVISPGPGEPKDAGISCDVIREFAGKIPIFGVCLGHQCIYEIFGGRIGHAGEIMHGKTSEIEHDNRGVFKNVRPNLKAIRYHSLIGTRETLPDSLEISSSVKGKDMIMGVRHKSMPIEGVQFHPESILSEDGIVMMKNFLEM